MIVKGKKIDTRFLDGEEYLCQDDRLKEYDSPLQRDAVGRSILEEEGKTIRENVYVRITYHPGGEINYWVVSTDYKISNLETRE